MSSAGEAGKWLLSVTFQWVPQGGGQVHVCHLFSWPAQVGKTCGFLKFSYPKIQIPV